jgi:hypothetical protein
MTKLLNLLTSIVWTSTIAVLLVVTSIILILASAPDFFPLAITLSLGANALANLSRGAN